jgi:hypothetical protein
MPADEAKGAGYENSFCVHFRRIGCQRSEIRGQKSDVRCQRSVVSGSGFRGQRSEVRGQMSEVSGSAIFHLLRNRDGSLIIEPSIRPISWLRSVSPLWRSDVMYPQSKAKTRSLFVKIRLICRNSRRTACAAISLRSVVSIRVLKSFCMRHEACGMR